MKHQTKVPIKGELIMKNFVKECVLYATKAAVVYALGYTIGYIVADIFIKEYDKKQNQNK